MAIVVFPAPEGPTSATVLPARDGERDVVERGPRATGIGEADPHHLERRRVPGGGRRHPRPVGDGHGLGVHRVEALGGGEGVGELASDLRDLPHRDEGRHRQEREEGHARGLERTVRGQGRSGDGDGHAAQPRRDLLESALARQVAEKRHARLRVGDGARRELGVPVRLLLERRHLGEALDRIDGVGVEARRRPRAPAR